MRISLGYTFVSLLLALALTNQTFAAVYRPVNDDSSDESCEDPKSEVQCRLKPADDPGCYLELVPNHGWMRRSCPEGTLFSERDCGCSVSLPQQDQGDSDSSSEEDNGKAAPVPCTRKPTHDRRSYLQFVEGKGWNRLPCPDGTAYSAEDCSCTLFLSDDSSSSEENIWGKAVAKVCNREAEDDSHFYMEMVQGHGWIRRDCAKGTVFDARTCRCSASEDGSSDSSCEDDDSASEEWDGHCLLKAESSQNNFLQFVEGHGWMTRHCPKGTAFNAGDCGCTVSVPSDESSSSEEDSWRYQSSGKSQRVQSGYDDSSSSSSSSSEEDSNYWGQQAYGKGLSVHEGYGVSSSEQDGRSWNTANYRKGAIPCTRKPTHDKSSYLQFIEGKGWKTQPCPQGTAYSADDCACSVTVAHGDNDDSSSSEEDSHSWGQQTYGKTSSTRSGYGDSSSSEEDGHPWSHHGKGIKIPAGYGEISSEQDGSSWNTVNYRKGAFPCTRKPTHDKSSYLQFIDGKGWTSQPCPEGTAYSANDCACSVNVAHGQSDDSSSSSSSEEDSNLGDRQTYSKGHSIHEDYGDSSSEEDGMSWNTASYGKGVVPCTRKATHDKSSYLQFIEGKGWKTLPCPRGTAYSADDCACSITVTPEDSDDCSSSEEESNSWSKQSYGKSGSTRSGFGDSSSEEDGSSWNTASYGKGAAPCTRKPTHDKISYLQFIEGKGWKRQPCPDGTAYSADDCACSISVAHGSRDESSSSSEEDSHSWSQQSYEKGSRVSAGYGDSSSVNGDSSWNTASYSKGPVPCTRKATHDKSSYAQFIEGWGWITQPCPKGTAYNADDCACSVTVAHGESDDSSSSSSSSEEDQYYWSQQSYDKGSNTRSSFGDSGNGAYRNSWNAASLGSRHVSHSDRDSSGKEEDSNSWHRATFNNGRASRFSHGSGSSYN